MKQTALLLLVIGSLNLLGACIVKKDPALAPLNLDKCHLAIKLERDVDYLIQRQGDWLDLEVSITNISEQPVLLKNAHMTGAWDRNHSFFKIPEGVIRYNYERDEFEWYEAVQQKGDVALAQGLLFPGDSVRVQLTPRLMVAPSVTRSIIVDYYPFRDDKDLSEKVYFPSAGTLRPTFRKRPASLLHHVRSIEVPDRLAILKSGMAVAQTFAAIEVAFNPKAAPQDPRLAMKRVGIKKLQEGNYIFSVAMQRWIFQKGKDCWVVTRTGAYRVHNCDIRIFDMVDHCRERVPLRFRHLAAFQKQSGLPDILYKHYDRGVPAYMPKYAFEQLLQEAEHFAWSLETGERFNNPNQIFVDNH
ncbi:hypothetical protein ACFL54_00950 [Planctomycetota bacterium]